VAGAALVVWIGVQPPNEKALTLTLATTALLLGAWWLGSHGSSPGRRGALFFRGDFGFDLAIDRPSSESRSPRALMRANLAGGVHVDPVDLTLELVNVAALNGDISGIDNRFIHTLGVGLSTRGTNQFRFGTVFPLDEAVRGEIWILSLGYQHATD